MPGSSSNGGEWKLDIEQSLPICIGLAIAGGLLEVAATACTAAPSVRAVRKGDDGNWPKRNGLRGLLYKYLPVAANISLQGISSVLGFLIATWYGPIAMVVPFFYSSTLLANIVIFGTLLGIEFFTKTAKNGTLVIVVSVIILPVVGPSVQDNQDITLLISKWYAFVWFGILVGVCAITGLIVCFVDIKSKFKQRGITCLLLLARASSISINLTVSKGFVSNLDATSWIFGLFLVLKVVSGWIYTYAIVVQSTAIEHQSKFLPLNTTCIITLNALTGIIIWEDYKVMASWYGYACVFLLLGLGCELLLDTDVPLLTDDNPDFGVHKRASVVNVISKRRRRNSEYLLGRNTQTLEHNIVGNKRATTGGMNRKETDSLLTPSLRIIAEECEKEDKEAEEEDTKLIPPPPPQVSSPVMVFEDSTESFEDAEEQHQQDEQQRDEKPPKNLTKREAWQYIIGIPTAAVKHTSNHLQQHTTSYGSIFNADLPPKDDDMNLNSSTTSTISTSSAGAAVTKNVFQGASAVATKAHQAAKEGATNVATGTKNVLVSTGTKVKEGATTVATKTTSPVVKAFKSVFSGGSDSKSSNSGGNNRDGTSSRKKTTGKK